MLRRAAQLRPRGEATVCGTRRRSWAAVADRVARAAGGLRTLGVRSGDRVAILAFNSDAYFEAWFAVPWAGGVLVPLNTRQSPAELAWAVADCGAVAVCIDRAFAAVVPVLRSRCPALRIALAFDDGAPGGADDVASWQGLVDASGPAADAGRGGDALAAICYTGGSTGRPKGVMLSHANLAASAVNACWQIGHDTASVFLHASPMFHLTDGMSTLAVTMAAGTHVFVPRFEPHAVLHAIGAERVTHLTLVPTMVAMLLDVEGIEGMSLGSLRQLMFGAAPMPEATLRRAVAIWPGLRFLHGWGMTELAPLGTMLPAALRDPAVAGERLRSCGHPMPNLELRIVDDAGADVPRGGTGEIVVRGPMVMQGYWNQPELTAAVLSGGWLRTGDAARMDDEGLVWIVDRLKDMIISGGENIWSTEVENAISLMPGVEQVAVIGIPDDVWGVTVHAIVVPSRDGPAEISQETVIAWARLRLAAYKAPKSVSLRDDRLPVSGAGKVLKTELRAPFWAGRPARI